MREFDASCLTAGMALKLLAVVENRGLKVLA